MNQNQSIRIPLTLASILTALFALLVGSVTAAPHNGDLFKLKQPDGTFVEVKVWGDEFYQRVESLDGYTLIRDPKTRWICYAELSDDESDFVSTDIVYQGLAVAKNAIPKSRKNGLPLAKKLKLKKKAIKKKVARAQKLLLGDAIASGPGGAAQRGLVASVSAAPLSGSVLGLTLLIDFPDVPATISRNEVDDYANFPGYSGYGNNGSVMDYFNAISNGALDYTNYVTEYYTALNNKSYYTDETIPYGTRARELINEALDDLDAGGFDFSILSTDADDYILAINAFYAGQADNAWAEGIWPHQGTLNSRTFDGVHTWSYQITNMGSSLRLNTFCHENGHMICDWPDLYDYGYESSGTGDYCLMSGGNGTNPIPPNPHFRDLKGWETIIEISTDPLGTLRTHNANSFTTYRHSHPGNPKEFFLLESRIKSGRNAQVPDEGLLIWHIDEDGSNENEQMTPSQHYLVSVEQADGQFHLENGDDSGGSGDLFHAGYRDAFEDDTNPDARWWSGEESYLSISSISAVGASMTFVVQGEGLPSCPYTCGDLDGAGVNVDMVDFALFASCWGKNPQIDPNCVCANLVEYDDYIIDLLDLSVLADLFLSSSESHAPDCPTSITDPYAPAPDPMDFSWTPAAAGDSSIAMMALRATDSSGVQYYFNCTSVGGHDSGWQDSRFYEDSGLLPETTYTYTVKARDKSVNQNETLASAGASATTDKLDLVLPANGGNLDFFTSEYGDGWFASDLTNGIKDEDGWASVENPAPPQEFIYSFQGGNNAVLEQAIIYGGTAEGLYYSKDVEVWTSVNGTSFTLAGSDTLLEQNDDSVTIPLGDVVAKKIKLVVTSGYSTEYWELAEFVVNGAIQPPPEDNNAPTPDPMTFASAPTAIGAYSIAMMATTATDVLNGVEYYFTCTAGGGNDSGWQTSSIYQDTSLSPETSYTYTVKARDLSANYNETGDSEGASATTDPVIVENVVLPANGGNLDSFTSEYGGDWIASDLTNGITDEDGWSSATGAVPPQDFVYSFSGGNNATLNNAMIHGGTAEGGLYYSKDVEIWISTDGSAYTMQAFGTLANSTNYSLPLGLGGVEATKVKLVITSGYNVGSYVELAEFEVYGEVID